MRMTISILKALSDETRVRILLALSMHELCVCQITKLLGLSPSTVSKHLSILYNAELVNMRKSGKWVYYSLAKKATAKSVREILEWVITASKASEAARRDLAKLKKIAASSPEVLCEKKGK